MKATDFTHPGGFPLTQDQLDWLQKAYTESTAALALIGVNSNAPVIISGIVTSFIMSGGGLTLFSAGWLFYNGELIRFTGGSVGPMIVGEALYFVISTSASPLTFNDGSTPNVIVEKTAGLAVLPDTTPSGPTLFQYGELLPFGKGFGILNREQTWHSLFVNTDPALGGVTGNVFYKKDFTANTLQIRGLLSANHAQNFSASPTAIYYIMTTLPTNYIPINNVYFTGYYFVATLIKDDLGISWIKQLSCGINTSGQLYINWIKPDVAIGGYGINFNVVVPLD